MKKRAFKKRLKYMRTWVNAWDVALFWNRVNDLILQAYLQKWPDPVVVCLLDLLSALHPAYDQRRRLCKRYGVKEK